MLEKVIEFDKVSSGRTSMSCSALFILNQLVERDWR